MPGRAQGRRGWQTDFRLTDKEFCLFEERSSRCSPPGGSRLVRVAVVARCWQCRTFFMYTGFFVAFIWGKDTGRSLSRTSSRAAAAAATLTLSLRTRQNFPLQHKTPASNYSMQHPFSPRNKPCYELEENVNPWLRRHRL